jgi:S-adenosylmethionine:tRNA ribosyltransferase-isomerase
MKTADFDFDLPQELIALRPVSQRDASRLLVLHRTGSIEHRSFGAISEYLKPGDMLLLNDTRVLPVRLIGTKPTGGKIDIILVKQASDGLWEILCKGSYEGLVDFRDGVSAEISIAEGCSDEAGGGRRLRFIGAGSADINGILERCGYMPLPPYIKRQPDEDDRTKYQTVYAEKPGSIAAPTAGLHFTTELLDSIEAAGVITRYITLHVGPGTFRPINSDLVKDHKMLAEYFEVEEGLPEEIEAVKSAGGKVITVGTTSTRAIEGLLSGSFSPDRDSRAGFISGYTDIFICPGHKFAAPDALLTNFHLPRSTPLMLAAAFCGIGRLMEAYRSAIARGYRFFSYGDAMLIL